MVYLLESAFHGTRRIVRQHSIEINPRSHSRTVKIGLSLTPHVGQLVGGDTDMSIYWGDLFYDNLKQEIEGLDYKVGKVLTVENTGDGIKDYQLFIEFNGKQVASCGPVERERHAVHEDGSGVPRTHIIPTSGSISFYVGNKRLFATLLNGLIKNPNGVIGRRYRLALERSGTSPEKVEEIIGAITQPPENKPHFYLQGSIASNL